MNSLSYTSYHNKLLAEHCCECILFYLCYSKQVLFNFINQHLIMSFNTDKITEIYKLKTYSLKHKSKVRIK